MLDQHDPGWENRIDIPELDLDHMEKCIIGQLYGDFCNIFYPHMWKGDGPQMPPGFRKDATGRLWELGFAFKLREPDTDEFKEEWRRAILKRRGKL